VLNIEDQTCGMYTQVYKIAAVVKENLAFNVFIFDV